MGLLRGFLIAPLIVALIACLMNWYLKWNFEEELKKLEEWSEKHKISVDNTNFNHEEFEIKFDVSQWKGLVEKLNNTRYFDSIDLNYAQRFELGFDVDYAKHLVDYWKQTFDWKKQIDRLNRFKQYKLVLDDTTLHFMRVNEYHGPEKSEKIPLLLLSGWPGSFFEFYKAIDLINKKYNNEKRYFDIVVPSIPGYAFSTPLKKPNDVVDTARLYDGLMRHLFGNDCKYFVHGEDWGSMITVSLSQMYPTRVHGIHVTMVSPFKGSPIDQIVYGALLELAPNYMLTDAEKESTQTFTPLKRFRKLISKTGYLHYQATKPDTLGFGLTDSPVGLMTYLLEKYAFGSFSYYDVVATRDGNLEEFSKDDLLTIVTIYWMTNSITSSMRIYKWVFDKFSVNLGWPKAVIDSFPTPKSVPVAVMYAKNEIDHVPYCLLKNIFGNLKQYNILKEGGHFIAFQRPELAISDLMTFIDSVLA